MKYIFSLALASALLSVPMLAQAQPIKCSVSVTNGKNDGSRPGGTTVALKTFSFDSKADYSPANEHIQVSPTRFASVTPINKELWVSITEELGSDKERTVGAHYPISTPTFELVDEASGPEGYTQYRLSCSL